jgi:hypothetical protein
MVLITGMIGCATSARQLDKSECTEALDRQIPLFDKNIHDYDVINSSNKIHSHAETQKC